MGKIINALLGNKNKDNYKMSTLDMFTPFFSNSANPKLNDTFMSCCQAHARHGAKFAPMVYLKDKPSTDKKYITDLLCLRPNALMNAPTFWEKITENYFELNNVFLFLDYDWSDFKKPLKAIYPLDIDNNQIEVRKGDDNKLYMRFMMDGQAYVTSMEQIVHIARNVNTAEFFGQGNEAIRQVLKVIQTNYEGIDQAIKTSAFLRFVVQSITPLNDKVLEEKAQYFAKQYLGKNASGVAYLDSASNIIQVNSQAKYVNAEEMKLFEDKIYKYLGINEKILTASYNEDDYAMYYESSLEPLALKIITELEYKLFTETERAHGNRIVINQDRLQTASMKTRILIANIIQKLPQYKPNTINDLLFLPRTEYGDAEYSTLNYVKSSEQSKYQGTETKENNNKENKEGEGENGE